MSNPGKVFAVAIAAMGLFGVTAASAATIDFTTADPFTQPDVFGVSVSVTANGGSGTATTFDGGALGSGAPCQNSPLACISDGIGVGDDEITGNGVQSVDVAFSGPLSVTGFHFLDLFFDPNANDQEAAQVLFNGDVVASYTFAALEAFQVEGGYGFFAIAPTVATSLRFIAASGNDGVGNPDYALAGIDVSAVPLPASGLLLLFAVGGFGFLSRRRGAAA
ncbi:hypothetical protein G5B40_20405 [Pikeienuella piscinae]|uniref:PEP-CTERM protein-sorting domain-containing protein n=1 Tax=Pikeienuella piscinae TaxID=2748098 RepID=A0A7M3T6H2_9RHOB|nr:VPLPA-CTERM sorting domain-containing protein [Pikeienuella piscinae]QIE57603.1 hypothetical protein G5B40_20405 [Pikeienuella piscinae]